MHGWKAGYCPEYKECDVWNLLNWSLNHRSAEVGCTLISSTHRRILTSTQVTFMHLPFAFLDPVYPGFSGNCHHARSWEADKSPLTSAEMPDGHLHPQVKGKVPAPHTTKNKEHGEPNSQSKLYHYQAMAATPYMLYAGRASTWKNLSHDHDNATLMPGWLGASDTNDRCIVGYPCANGA